MTSQMINESDDLLEKELQRKKKLMLRSMEILESNYDDIMKVNDEINDVMHKGHVQGGDMEKLSDVKDLHEEAE